MYLVDLHILPAILDPLVSSVGFAPVGLLLFVIAVAAFTTETVGVCSLHVCFCKRIFKGSKVMAYLLLTVFLILIH